MIPTIKTEPIDQATEGIEIPTLTYKLDIEKGKIIGKVDQLEAMKQAVFKRLETDRYYHPIYSWEYGHELKELIGRDPVFVLSEAQRLIKEALMTDDRIEAIEGFEMSQEGDVLLVQFNVVTIYGQFAAEVRSDV